MKVAFDYQMFVMQKYGGITRYYTSLVRELASIGETPRVFAPTHWNQYLRQLSPSLVEGRYTEKFLPGRAYYLNALFNRWTSRVQMSAWKPAVIHETYYARKRTGPRGIPTVVTVFDMIHELFADQFPPDDTTRSAKAAAVGRADHVICISASTRNDLIRILGLPPQRVSVVQLAADLSGDTSEHRPASRAATGPPYLLFVGDRRGYKNFTRFLEAVAASPALRKDFRVVAFGGHPFSPAEAAMAEALGLSKMVEHATGDDAALAHYYRHAQALVYPSLYEGFGLPPLEAMGQDCPVIASNTSSIPEVVGDSGELFDPTDTEAMTRSIERVVYSEVRRLDLIDRGRRRVKEFSWARCARETSAVYRLVSA